MYPGVTTHKYVMLYIATSCKDRELGEFSYSSPAKCLYNCITFGHVMCQYYKSHIPQLAYLEENLTSNRTCDLMSYTNSLFRYFIQSQYWVSVQEILYTNTVMHYYISPAC